MTKKVKTDLDKLLKRLKETCGKYWGDWDGDEPGTYQIECMDDMEYDVDDILDELDYEVLEKNWFSGSEFDGYLYVIKLHEGD